MSGSFFRVVAIFIATLILAACASTSERSEEESLLTSSLNIPGAHLAFADNPPQGFQIITTTSPIYQLHDNGEDIWFYVQTEDIANIDANGGLRAWLTAIEALHFPLDQASLFWIPADPLIDRLDFAEKSKLTDAIDPTQQAKLWRHRGDQMRTQGSYGDAITAYLHSTMLNETDPESLAGLGAAYMGQGKNESALVAFQKAIELDPDHYWAHRLLGNAYLNLHRYDLAADELTQAYILNPQDTRLLIGIALGQGRSGHPDTAISTLNQLFERSDDLQLHKDGKLLLQEFSQNQ